MQSTGVVLAAGGIAMTDLVLNDWDALKAVKLAVGTVAAAYVSAGLDKIASGFGTGLAVLLLVGALMTNVPRIVHKLVPN